MKKLLIQANNLDTVIDVFMYIYLHQGCSKQDISDYCGFSLRQVDYYTNACKYLDLINSDWSPTCLAIDIFNNSRAEITERVYERIIEDEVIGKIFSYIKSMPDDYPLDYAKMITKDAFPGYSESVYRRRSDNLVKWCKKIYSYFENNNK